MPKADKKQDKRIAFMADRMALLILELVRRDMDFGRFCHEEFYTDEIAGYLQQGKDYDTCLDFVRMMIKKHDKREKENGASEDGARVYVPNYGEGDAGEVG